MLNPIPFGKYWLLERISVGGMAEIFKAKTFGVQGFEKTIAIKRILPNMAEDKEFIAMFVDEAKLAVQLNHPNICQIYELGRNNDSHYIAMEFIHGKDLLRIQSRLRREGRILPLEMSIYTIARILSALDYAHRKQDPRLGPLNLVHRDISPQNIIISYEGDVKLIDFGIAKATSRSTRTQVGVLKGKFGYMSPEQVNGQDIDRRSDIFSVGTVLAELLTGKRLFAAESDYATLEKIRRAEYEPLSSLNPEIDSELEAIMAKALVADREHRYAWANEFQEDLEKYLIDKRLSFSQSKTASWMKDNFVEDLAREKQLLKKQHQLLEEGIRKASERKQQQVPAPGPENYQDMEGQTIVSHSPLLPPPDGSHPHHQGANIPAPHQGMQMQDGGAPYPYGGHPPQPGSMPGVHSGQHHPGMPTGPYGPGDPGAYQQQAYGQHPQAQHGQFTQQQAPAWASPQGDSQPTAAPPWATGDPYAQQQQQVPPPAYGQPGSAPGAVTPPPPWATPPPEQQGQYGMAPQPHGGPPYQQQPYGMPQQFTGQPSPHGHLPPDQMHPGQMYPGQMHPGQMPYGVPDPSQAAGMPPHQGPPGPQTDPATLPLAMPEGSSPAEGDTGDIPEGESQGLPAFAQSDQLTPDGGAAADHLDQVDDHEDEDDDEYEYEEEYIEETSVLRTIMLILVLLLITGGLAGGGYWLYMAKFKSKAQPEDATATITVSPAKELELTVTPQTGFQAFLDDRFIGDTSPINIFLKEEKGSLTIKALGYLTHQENLEPRTRSEGEGEEGQETVTTKGDSDSAEDDREDNNKMARHISLTPDTGTVQVSMAVFPNPERPFQVTAELEGGGSRMVYQSSAMPLSLAPGTYNFTIEREARAPETFQTKLEAGQIYKRYTTLMCEVAALEAAAAEEEAQELATAAPARRGRRGRVQPPPESTVTIFAGKDVTAAVLIDGVETGMFTPVHTLNPLKLTPGEHTLRLVSGRRVVEQVVKTSPGPQPPVITSF